MAFRNSLGRTPHCLSPVCDPSCPASTHPISECDAGVSRVFLVLEEDLGNLHVSTCCRHMEKGLASLDKGGKEWGCCVYGGWWGGGGEGGAREG